MGDSHPSLNRPQPLPAPYPATTIPATTIPAPNPATTIPATTIPAVSYAAAVHGGNPPVLGELSNRELKKTFFDGGPKKRLGQASIHQGRKTIRFSGEEIEMLAKPFRFALIGKFSHGYPTMQTLRLKMASFGLRGDFSIGVINLKHVLIRLTLEEDYTRLWLRQIVYIEGFPMRLFKWTPKFNPQEESPFAPVWVRFPNLPVQFFDKDALFCIAEMIGNPLRIDEATTDVTRPSVARVCVEIDLTKPLDDEIAIGFDSMLWTQKLYYERIPKYCSICKHLGHNSDECRGKNSATNAAGPSRNVTTVNGKVDGDKIEDLRSKLNQQCVEPNPAVVHVGAPRPVQAAAAVSALDGAVRAHALDDPHVAANGKISAHTSDNAAANGQKRDQDPLAHTSDNAAAGNRETNAQNAHTSDNDSQHNAHKAPCPAAEFAEMEEADSSIAAAAHVANKDAAAAAAFPHAAHASENIAHAPASPAVPHVATMDAAAAAAVPHAARASDNAHAPASPAVPHVANKDAAAAAAVHAAEDASTSAAPRHPHEAEDASTSAAPRHPPAGHDQLHVSHSIAPKKKKHKNEEIEESCKNEKKKEKKKKKGKIAMPDLLPDESKADYALRVLRDE